MVNEHMTAHLGWSGPSVLGRALLEGADEASTTDPTAAAKFLDDANIPLRHRDDIAAGMPQR